MTRDDLYGYYRRYYVPNNASLVIVGDVDADDVVRRASTTSGRLRRGASRFGKRPSNRSRRANGA